MLLTGSQILMECLLEQDVDTIFGYPGGSVLFIYDEIYKYSHKIHHILTSHEQGASHAADGYARSTGKPGVCIATSGPGATNLVTGIATAYMDSSPVVFITGNVAVDLIGKDSFQEADITGITMPITKYNCIVKDVTKLAEIVRKAFAIAKSGRPGPVLIDIPKDISNTKTEYTKATDKELNQYNSLGAKTSPVSSEEVETFKEMIVNAKKPYILVGGGVTRGNAFEETRKFAEMIKAPVGCTLMALGSFPGNHIQFSGTVGMHGSKASNLGMSECDLLISLGSRFSDRVIGDVRKFARNAKVVHVDVDGAEIDKNVVSHHSIVDEIKNVLTKMISAMQDCDLNMKPKEEWLAYIESLKKHNQVQVTTHKGRITANEIFDDIYKATKGDVFIVTDVGQHQMWAAKYFSFDFPKKLITSGGFGTMGFGAGAAIGTQAGNPGSHVLHIAGDGSFRMNCNELSTEEYYKLPIITIIINNGTLGMVRQWQTLFYEGRYSNTDLDRGPDFVKLADAYGIKGYEINTMEEFNEALSESLNSGKPAVLNCLIGMDDNVTPMVASGKPINQFVLD